jgi:Na+/H+-dicarboxylate symporter
VESNSHHDIKSLSHLITKYVRTRLWLKVIIGMVLGVVAGVIISPNFGWLNEVNSRITGNWLALPGKLFLKLVQMIIVPLIFSSIVTGLAGSSTGQLRKMGPGVVLYFVFTTIVSITIGIVLALVINPGKYFSGRETLESAAAPITVSENAGKESMLYTLPNTISDLLPSNPLASMVTGEMLSIVIFSIIVGIAVLSIATDLGKQIVTLLSAIQQICMTVVQWAMKIVPYAVFGLMAQVVATAGLTSLAGVGVYSLTVVIGLVILLLFYIILLLVLGRANPFKFLSRITDVQLLAFSTTSSAAVMPLSIQVAEEKLGIRESISRFIIPIGVTVNMDGTALYQAVSVIFIAEVYGVHFDIPSLVLLMFTIVAASIGTPAIPGGGVVVLASILQAAGIPAAGLVLIIGIERILGMFRTAVNVTGDLTACMVFNERMKELPGDEKST